MLKKLFVFVQENVAKTQFNKLYVKIGKRKNNVSKKYNGYD